MMNEATLEYARRHADDDVRQLALRGSKDAAVDMTAALQQIAGRQLAKKKLPSWAATEGMLYPPHLSMEQCSSEQTARYKAEVIAPWLPADGALLVDLTGGFGVDFSFMAQSFSRAVYVERQAHLCSLVSHNLRVLGLDDAEVVCVDGTDYLHKMEHAAVIFVDPARRDEHGARTYGIADCTPDVLAIRDELLSKCDCLLLKLSSMLDWRKTVSDLGEQWVREVHIVSVGGECKELLVLLSAREAPKGLRLVCANDESRFVVEKEQNEQGENTGSSRRGGPSRSSEYSEYSEYSEHSEHSEYSEHSEHSDPSEHSAVSVLSGKSVSSFFLYEPNASIMKAGCFAELSHCYGVAPLSQNSHLFLSKTLVADFPGRRFRLLAVSSMNKRELKEKVGTLKQANITVRNFPLSVAELRKRLKINEGGSNYLFATTLANGDHVLLVCQKA